MRIRLIHWNREEGGERAEALRQGGFAVDFEPFGKDVLKGTTDDSPDAVVIDLTRMPSQGRDVGIAIRRRKSTRHLPLVFAAGNAEKVAAVRKLLPDAAYSSWEDIGKSLKFVSRNQPVDPVVPSSQFAGYSGRPLATKLGISEGIDLLLLDPPDGFEAMLGPLPRGARIKKRAAGKSRIVILFARSQHDLAKCLGKASNLMAEGGSLWIAWQKKASGAGSDLTQAKVRRKGLDSGLVDYRICSIDGIWSGLRFARRDK